MTTARGKRKASDMEQELEGTDVDDEEVRVCEELLLLHIQLTVR